MTVSLIGNSPSTLTAGILLLSRARSFGHPFSVHVVGDKGDLAEVKGPALVHSAVLASCGVGRKLGSGGLCIVPGQAMDPLAVSIADGGVGEWFYADRSGVGISPATQQFVALCRDSRPPARHLARQLRKAIGQLGCVAEPAVLDILFSSPAVPLVRLAMALRAGRSICGEDVQPITRFLNPFGEDAPDPIPTGCTLEQLSAMYEQGALQPFLDRIGIGVLDSIEEWLEGMRELAELGGEERNQMCPSQYGLLLTSLFDIGSHLAGLPANCMLPPLAPAQDGVAVGLGAALGAVGGNEDANRQLVEVFSFLGGRFTDTARYPVSMDHTPPPEGRLERWAWFCEATSTTAAAADALWRKVVDPVQ